MGWDFWSRPAKECGGGTTPQRFRRPATKKFSQTNRPATKWCSHWILRLFALAKKFCCPIYIIHIKKPMEERGAGGGTVRLWSAVPSPGHKKTKDFKLNQGITKDLNFISLFIMELFSRGRNHLKTAINLSCYALLRNPNSDFPCGKDRCFLPRLPNSPWLGRLQENRNYNHGLRTNK